ncbi:unnamed protein product (macronuclear) [Paramecium tetraurelia]|uniref:RING-type domain-containing protein n=1 Tax=Paramecium tetraurelia TaxID=5888 RepID=A0DM56_PARTE|nr:uncharacterized protein GSPATT00018341001 [Paramecium tetraurelia]CAK84123.1 unnamed protein product [Paramecium tetraurelia]|eukprot:XP_001451520.1 hypothetical protein (macronuclear) [Paramecium tetraurelia strain d4-2]
MGSNLCKQDNSSSINTIDIEKKPETIDQPKKNIASGAKNSQVLTSQDTGQIQQIYRNIEMDLKKDDNDSKVLGKEISEEGKKQKGLDKGLKNDDKALKSQNKKCSKCDDFISLTFVQLNCNKNCCYHHLCMEEHLKKLIDSGKPVIKCKCGTKLNTNCLRQSSVIGKMNLLSRLFEKQLDLILQSSQQIRRDVEVQNYVQQNRISKELQDYFLMKQDSLTYEETPQ